MTHTLYIDTETGPSRRQDVWAWLAAKNFDPAADVEARAKKAADALERTSLQATLCELWVASVAVNEDEPVTLVSNGDEGDLVRRLSKLLNDGIASCRKFPLRIVAFNEEFDRNVIKVAAMRHQVPLHKLVHAVDVKPWGSAWRCAQAPLRTAWNDNVSLEQACIGFGIPLSFGEAGDLPGREVGAAIARGELARVAHHCGMDVRRVREVWKRIVSIQGAQ